MVAVSFTTLSGFRALYEAEYGFVWSAVRRFGVPSPLLEDAVQDTFIVAYRRRDSFAPGPARPWLYGIARGVASNYRRTARRVERKREALASAVDRSAGGGAQISLQALDRFLRRLEPDDRELFVLSEVEGLTGPELASALRLQTRTIYRRLERLRHQFADEAIEGTALRPRRPRASAAGWVALVPSLRDGRAGWLGVGATKGVLATIGIVGVASVAWVATDPPVTAPARQEEAAARSFSPPTVPATEPPPDPTPVAVPSVVPEAEPVSPLSRPRPPRARQAEAPDLSRENALLRGATEAIARGDYDEALASTGRHATEFPASALADLRSALRIEALCGAGRAAQARGEARVFIAAHPGAPMVERIRRACASKPAVTGQGPM